MTIHVIHFSGSIHHGTSNQIQECSLRALKEGATALHFHISTDGGSTTVGFALYNFLRSLPVQITMHNMGSIESMGNILFLAGDTRVAAPHSRFLIHPLHWDFTQSGTVDHARLNERAACLANDLERYVSIFNERTEGGAQPLDVRSCLSNAAQVLTAEAATSANIAHSVAALTLPATAITWWITA